eukprot:1683413-Pyramimonas_sp.AAC.1
MHKWRRSAMHADAVGESRGNRLLHEFPQKRPSTSKLSKATMPMTHLIDSRTKLSISERAPSSNFDPDNFRS